MKKLYLLLSVLFAQVFCITEKSHAVLRAEDNEGSASYTCRKNSATVEEVEQDTLCLVMNKSR